MTGRLRIATYNLENLDDRNRDAPRFERRIAALRPILEALAADIICLQEVDGQKGPDGKRHLRALDRLLDGTRYASFERAVTATEDGDPADAHNLVILSRLPIAAQRQVRHDLVPPPAYRPTTAEPAPHEAQEIEWERPLLHAALALPGGRNLHVLNLHLRAPLAAPVAGQKGRHGRWKSVGGWAEGFFLAAVKRIGQAVEARLVVDRLFAEDAEARIVVAGDLNADLREMPLRVLRGDVEETGNPGLARFMLHAPERALDAGERFSVRHKGEGLMLDHLLVSPVLQRAVRDVAIGNAGLPDEVTEADKGTAGSFHAPLLVELDLGRC